MSGDNEKDFLGKKLKRLICIDKKEGQAYHNELKIHLVYK
jgi:hypothetical protein